VGWGVTVARASKQAGSSFLKKTKKLLFSGALAATTRRPQGRDG
jgi:hypothetical protein